jgi:hypothetical protein
MSFEIFALLHYFHVLFDFSSKVEARQSLTERFVVAQVEAPPHEPVPPANKGKQGAMALRETSAMQVSCSASVKGHGRRSAVIDADLVLLNT